MSTPSIVKAATDAAGNAEQQAPITQTEHAVGAVSSDSVLVKAPMRFVPKFFQRVQETPIEDFLTRLTEIATWTIQTTDTTLSAVYVIDPWQLFLANAGVADKTKNFTLIRGTLELLIVSAIPPSSYGSYVVSALPNAGEVTGADCAGDLDPVNCMQVDHYTRIDCSASDNAVVQLPFMWPFDFAVLPTGPAKSWLVTLSCLSALRSGMGDGAVTGSMKVFARLLPGYEMTIPHFQGRRGGHLSNMQTAEKYIKEAQQSKVVSKTANMVGDVADKLRGIPIVGEAATAVSWAAHGVAEVASWFGFTRDSDEKHPLPVAHRTVTNVAHFDGADAAETAAFTVANQISTDPTLVGGPPEDVASFTSLFARWTLIDIFTWAPVDNPGALIGSFPVAPSYCMGNASIGYKMTVPGYVGLPFSFWRGDMEYLLYIPVSKFHRGSLQVVWAPNGSSPAGLSVTNLALNYILDASAQNEYEFKVGFAREEPFLHNRISTYFETITYPGYENGRVWLRVVNPLVSQNPTGSVDVLVFARGGSNLEFAQPRSSITGESADNELWTTYFKDVSIYQGALGDDGDKEKVTEELVASSGDYPSDALLWGERIASVRALLQKPSRLYLQPDVYSPLTTQLRPVACLGPCSWVLPGNAKTDPFASRTTYQCWYRALFTGIAASERFKIFSSKPVWVGAAPVFNDPSNVAFDEEALDTLPLEVSTLAPMTYSGPQLGAEINVPYYQARKFLLGRRYYQPGVERRYNVIYMNVPSSASDDQPDFAVYHSFGADIRLTCFRQVPGFHFTNKTAVGDHFYGFGFWGQG